MRVAAASWPCNYLFAKRSRVLRAYFIDDILTTGFVWMLSKNLSQVVDKLTSEMRCLVLSGRPNGYQYACPAVIQEFISDSVVWPVIDVKRWS